MNLGPETEYVEHKRSTGELREGMESIASILNKHGHGTLFFGVRNDGEVVGQDVSDSTLRKVSQAIGSSNLRPSSPASKPATTTDVATLRSASRAMRPRTPATGASGCAWPTRT